jgi:hypothetical protein
MRDGLYLVKTEQCMVDDRNYFYYPLLFVCVVLWVLGYILCIEIRRIKVVYLTLLLTTLGHTVAQLV